MHDDPTPRLVFPDTTVLINFALVDEMPLLGQLVANNGSWCGTVASECDDQASKQGLPHMRDAHDIFGEPLRLETPAEFVNFRLNQDFFRQASTNPDATHAGESETLAILTSRSIKSVVVSDDEGVPLRLANLDVSPTIQATTSWHFFVWPTGRDTSLRRASGRSAVSCWARSGVAPTRFVIVRDSLNG